MCPIALRDEVPFYTRGVMDAFAFRFHQSGQVEREGEGEGEGGSAALRSAGRFGEKLLLLARGLSEM